MIVKNSKKEKNTVTFDVELDAAEFEKYVNGAYLKARSRIMVPGFRKGKVTDMEIDVERFLKIKAVSYTHLRAHET